MFDYGEQGEEDCEGTKVGIKKCGCPLEDCPNIRHNVNKSMHNWPKLPTSKIKIPENRQSRHNNRRCNKM